jgi:hypothetical protein
VGIIVKHLTANRQLEVESDPSETIGVVLEAVCEHLGIDPCWNPCFSYNGKVLNPFETVADTGLRENSAVDLLVRPISQADRA